LESGSSPAGNVEAGGPLTVEERAHDLAAVVDVKCCRVEVTRNVNRGVAAVVEQEARNGRTDTVRFSTL
jgi:hypothetical protein